MKFYELVKIVREAMSHPNLLITWEAWMSSPCEYKMPDFTPENGEFNGRAGKKLLSLDAFHHVVSNKSGTLIHINLPNPEKFAAYDLKCMNPVHGLVLDCEKEDGKKEADILIAPDNTCWYRFTAVKELMHLYAGTAKDALHPNADDITRCAKDSRRIIPTREKELDDETAAFYMAIEVLLPWSLREQVFFMRQKHTEYQIARAFMVPLNIIQHVFRGDDSNYSSLSFETNMGI